MKIRFIVLLSLMVVSTLLSAQQNMSLVANVQIDDDATDIWGYVDQSGIEYAIMGAINSTRIFSLEDPSNPVERKAIPGDRSGWRDIKSNGDYIYVIADQGDDGLLIIDMSNAEDTITYQYYNPIVDEVITSREDSVTIIDSTIVDGVATYDTSLVLQVISDTTFTFIGTCHNLYSTEGYIYLAGCNGGSRFNGVIILDPSDDPYKPEVIGISAFSYAHDVYVKGNTLYASEINRGALGIYDITDKTSPQLITSQTTGFNFTHNAWTNDDATVIFTTDERSNACIESYDISDLSNIQLLDRFKPLATVNLGVIPHNTHFLDGYLYTSYYTDGLIITDAHKPDNLIQVGQYDTWPGPHGGFNGNWGTYPFLPSGLIIASDRATGLYVLESSIKRACYLEGTITDKETGLAINGVDVKIKSKDLNSGKTDATGNYKTGQANAGNFDVHFLHPDYEVLIVNVNLVHGECLIYDAVMQASKKLTIDIVSTKSNTQESLSGVVVQLTNELNTYEFTTTEDGMVTDSFVNTGSYVLSAGVWGYKSFVQESINLQEDREIKIILEEGIEDDFNLDLGWTSSGSASTGQWERVEPTGTFFGNKTSNVSEDLSDDVGTSCYVTGNGGGNPGFDDVDNGDVILISPMSDLSDYVNPVVQYSLWFYNDGGADTRPDDTLSVYVTNQTDTVLIEQISDSLQLSGVWRDQAQITLTSLLTINDSIQFIFTTGDFEFGHIVEAGVDGFRIIDQETTSTSEVNVSVRAFAFPNPVEDFIYVNLENLPVATDWQMHVYDIDGQWLRQNDFVNEESISMKHLSSGTYILYLYSPLLNQTYTQKLVKI